MKNKIILIILIIFLFIILSCSSNTDNILSENVSPNLLTKIEKIFDNGITQTETFKYDSADNLIEYRADNGSEYLLTKYKYNEDNMMTSETNITNNKETYNKIYIYENSLLVREEWVSDDGSGYVEYTYNDNGDIMTYKSENDTPMIMDDEFYYYENTYDEKNRLIEQKTASIHIAGTTYYEYNDKDQLIRESYKSSYRDYTWEIINEYNDKGYLISSNHSTSDGETYITEYTYDSNGNKTSEHFNAEIMQYKSETIMRYEYDKNNRLIYSETKTTSDFDYEEDITITYIYDEFGNLIKEEQTGSGIKTITYEYSK